MLGQYLLESCFSSEISKNGMRAGGSLPLSMHYTHFKSRVCQIMTKIIMARYAWGAKMNVGTDESFLKLKFSQEIANNGVAG